MKLTRRKLRKLIMEHMIAPTFPAELSDHEAKIHAMIDSGDIENIRQADSLMKSLGYDNYVSQYLQNKHVGFAEKLGYEGGEIDRQLYSSDSNLSRSERAALSKKATQISDDMWNKLPDVAQQINPSFEKDQKMTDELLRRAYAKQHQAWREPK